MYGTGKRGHIIHWLYIAHLRALFTKAARDSELDLKWSQSNKHKNRIPDAIVTVAGKPYQLEVDNSTEGMRRDRIAGKPIDAGTLIVSFGGEERFRNLSTLGGLATFHGHFHDLEGDGFNILTQKCWWDGSEWASLVR